ncbi:MULTISPECIES: hypothetical protein [Nocardiopsis]|uniref:Uncharacterized protein n=1 Tax=Nocardiopsis sinuspersici TaxID=501010 RepID=A0A1V3BZ35_9ACTN|nr:MULTISPECIES: hypothetical protein [Nocardiopsis]NYH54609.1 hypothetical protein [Nocardiopsis sinuspersici]OOC53400.1 hypothetical protein NOSIN_05910 [Nocardiopsis sinuspersici]
MGQTNSPPDHVFLLGREIGTDGDVLSIRDPALRVLTVERVPCGVELGVALALLESTGAEDSHQVLLEVVRPSGVVALSMTGTIDTAPSDRTGVWARALHVVIDETGEWTVSAQVGRIRAVRVIDVVSKAAE